MSLWLPYVERPQPGWQWYCAKTTLQLKDLDWYMFCFVLGFFCNVSFLQPPRSQRIHLPLWFLGVSSLPAVVTADRKLIGWLKDRGLCASYFGRLHLLLLSHWTAASFILASVNANLWFTTQLPSDNYLPSQHHERPSEGQTQMLGQSCCSFKGYVCNSWRFWEETVMEWLDFKLQDSTSHPPFPKLASELRWPVRTKPGYLIHLCWFVSSVHPKFETCCQANALSTTGFLRHADAR